jgi:very-short-patch-repair endonuclease
MLKRMTHERARELRKYSTEAERRLWSGLRSRRLQGLRFRRQHPIGPYYADFVCSELKIIVEADGSHHHGEEQAWYDCRRTKFFEAQGFVLLRFENASILNHASACLAQIADLARRRLEARNRLRG